MKLCTSVKLTSPILRLQARWSHGKFPKFQWVADFSHTLLVVMGQWQCLEFCSCQSQLGRLGEVFTAAPWSFLMKEILSVSDETCRCLISTAATTNFVEASCFCFMWKLNTQIVTGIVSSYSFINFCHFQYCLSSSRKQKQTKKEIKMMKSLISPPQWGNEKNIMNKNE